MRTLVGVILLCVLGQTEAAETARTERSAMLVMGKPAGFQEAVYADDGTIKVHFEFNDRGRGPKIDATYRLAVDATPVSIKIGGVNYLKDEVDETLIVADGKAHWHNRSEDATQALTKSAFYTSLGGTPEESVFLARALLKARGGKLDLLPSGSARIEKLSSANVRGKAGGAKATLYAVHGVDLTPSYLWLDDKGRFFASYSAWFSMVREGYEDTLQQLGKIQESEEAKLATARARSLTHKLSKPLLIRNVRLFDSETLKVSDGQDVLISNGRIAAVGADATAKGATIMDGAGRMLMPGLWDMHVHIGGGADGLLHVASGVTTVRDLANDDVALSARQKAYEAGNDIGPRVIKAGFIDGRGPYAGPTKVFADDADEARADVEKYAATGYEQIKVYSSLKPELVAPIVEAAHAKGLRVSGHVPAFMTARQFVEAGVDEIQHVNFIMLNFFFDKVQDTRTPARFSTVAEWGATLDLTSRPVLDFIALLKQKQIVVDPTLATFENMFLERPGHMGPTFSSVIDRLPPTLQRGLRSGGGGLPVPAGMDQRFRNSWQRMVQMAGLLHRSGVTIVAGTDDIAGLTIARELELYVSAGIPPAEVLRIATLGAAKVMKHDKDYGRVTQGAVADLILVDGDPTLNISDIRKVRTVIRGDRWFDSAALFRSVGIAAE